MSRRVTQRAVALLLSSILALGAASPSMAENFPLRSIFIDSKVIETAELAKNYDKHIMVDVRSKMEFEVLHMDGAKHAPVTIVTFLKNLKKAAGGNKAAPIVFYCNGITCKKSFKADVKARKHGYTNTRVYDAGIFNWANSNPATSIFLGKKGVDKNKLIAKSEFTKRLIPKSEFIPLAYDKSYVVFDIREPLQRQEKNIKDTIKTVRSVAFDRLVANLKVGALNGKKILVVDAVGKQVRWLQYYLEEAGIKDYLFLKGGAKSL